MLRDPQEKRPQRGREEDVQSERAPKRPALHPGTNSVPETRSSSLTRVSGFLFGIQAT